MKTNSHRFLCALCALTVFISALFPASAFAAQAADTVAQTTLTTADAREMQQAKEYSNQLCREYGLSFTESKADPFRIPAWKKRLCRTIKEAMENCATREEFIVFMAEYGYKVRWEPNQKYITYTTPENVRCRDNKLFDQTLLRSSMDAYFDMGGCEYLESRIDATEYGELLPTVDDAVCGLISILDALNTGDNDRFHLETLHHSKQEIQRILERGGKIDRTVDAFAYVGLYNCGE